MTTTKDVGTKLFYFIYRSVRSTIQLTYLYLHSFYYIDPKDFTGTYSYQVELAFVYDGFKATHIAYLKMFTIKQKGEVSI